MAIWPPLAALVIYLTLEVNWRWGLVLVVPVLLAWQWISLRRQANAALVAAFSARDELGGQVAQAEVRKDTVRLIIAELREICDGTEYEPPQYLLDTSGSRPRRHPRLSDQPSTGQCPMTARAPRTDSRSSRTSRNDGHRESRKGWKSRESRKLSKGRQSRPPIVKPLVADPPRTTTPLTSSCPDGGGGGSS